MRVSVILLTLLASGAAAAQQAMPPAMPRSTAPVAIMAVIARRPPDVVLGTTRIWHLSDTPMQRTAAIEMRDGLPLHQHPDGAHYLYVLDGEMTATIAGAPWHLRRGDYLAIPARVPHRYVVAPGRRVLLLSMDSPPYDPARTVWLDGGPPARGK